MATFHENANVLLLSKREDDAVRLMAKVRFFHSHLPDHLRATLVKSTESKMIFAGDTLGSGNVAEGSSILVLPATKDAGRSETASVVICDEWAFHPYARENYASFKPTIDAGGSLWGVSTANGMGNLFHDIYIDARKEKNNFACRFLPWNLHPERNEAWYEEQKKDYTPEMLASEYPTDDLDAFVVSGGCPFDRDSIRYYLEEVVCEPLDMKLPPQFSLLVAEGIKVWETPITSRRYVIAGDPAEGVEGGDASGLTVLDLEGVQVADLHGHWDPDRFAHLANILGNIYNNALIAIERNNHGHAVLNVLINYLNYPRLYRHRSYDQKGKRHIYKAGWPTTPQAKAIMLADLAAAIREREVTIRDRAFFEEALEIGTRSPKHQRDDYVMKMGIAIQAMRSSQARSSGKAVKTMYQPAFRQRRGVAYARRP